MQRKKRSRHAGAPPQTLFVKVLGDSRAQPIAVASGDAGFKFLYPVATMTTISVLEVALCDGRIHIDSVLKRLGRGAVRLQIIEGRPAFTIRQRPDGFSEQRFSSSATHYIYVPARSVQQRERQAYLDKFFQV
ncbi:hypothetical protein HK105_204559 [Polyrhizophydium stewartii]|uniref:PilZ domain-containing protein n=1 Tax=Polyrhizophydium stewartii TaxID=2732419 RepID=A0ABR4N8K4_9FUNG